MRMTRVLGGVGRGGAARPAREHGGTKRGTNDWTSEGAADVITSLQIRQKSFTIAVQETKANDNQTQDKGKGTRDKGGGKGKGNGKNGNGVCDRWNKGKREFAYCRY